MGISFKGEYNVNSILKKKKLNHIIPKFLTEWLGENKEEGVRGKVKKGRGVWGWKNGFKRILLAIIE